MALWARRTLNRKKRWFPARAVVEREAAASGLGGAGPGHDPRRRPDVRDRGAHLLRGAPGEVHRWRRLRQQPVPRDMAPRNRLWGPRCNI
jgi:hypothetical protein